MSNFLPINKLLNNIGDARPDALSPLPVTDTASLFNQGTNQAVTTDFKVRNHYERDGRIYMAGVASPGGFNGNSSAFFQLASPTLLWVADWTGCSLIDKPAVPDPTVVGNNWVLMDVMLNPSQIVLAADGTSPLFRLTGTYIFGALNPGPYFFSNVQFPAAPWFDPTGIVSLRTISLEDLESNIMIPTGGAGGTPITKPLSPIG